MLLTLIRGINMGLAFALELGVLVALCFYGFAAGRNWFAKIGLGMVFALVFVLNTVLAYVLGQP